MTHQEHSNVCSDVVELLAENGFDGMAQAIEILMNEAMKLERSDVLQAAPYQRTDARRGYANGYKPKTVRSRLGSLELQVPQARGVEFYPSTLERGERSERALKLADAEMYVQGVSTRKVAATTQELCGLDIIEACIANEPLHGRKISNLGWNSRVCDRTRIIGYVGINSSSQVSRAAAALDEELDAWRNRPLGEMPYLILDARYEKVRHAGSVISSAVLVAIGITPEGKRAVIGVSTSLSEAEVHWRDFLASLQNRGLHGVQLIVSDNHAGLKAAREARFSGVPWQRCQFHLQQNAMQYVPKIAMRKDVAADLRAVFDAPDRNESQRQLDISVKKYAKSAPKLSAWMEANIPEGLAVFELPAAHRRRLRTTNMLERVNKEIKRRTRVATLFPNEASLLRLTSAVLVEITEEWETGKRYLNTETD